jgi:hypothetical protein
MDAEANRKTLNMVDVSPSQPQLGPGTRVLYNCTSYQVKT